MRVENIMYQIAHRLLWVFALLNCMSLHAESEPNSGQNPPQSQNERTTTIYGSIYVSENTKIYVEENTKIYDNDIQPVKQTLTNKNYKKTAGIKKEATDYAVDETNASERQPASVVLPDFPLSPSSSSFLLYNRESAIIPPQKRNNGQQWISNACFVITYKHITNPILSPFLPEQRQKLSTSATQCGMLTSFGSDAPPSFA